MQFCVVFHKWVHWIDDVVDKDQSVSPDATIRVNLEAAAVFSENEFFQRNKTFLTPLILQAARAFGDSVRWSKRKSRRDRRAADILKSVYHEIFWHVAYLCAAQNGNDGWAHMTAMTEKYRAFNYDYKD